MRSTFHPATTRVPALMHEGSITISIRASVQEIERLNRLVRHFGELHELPSRVLYSVNLALDEVVSNVVLYGYDEDQKEGTITVKINLTGTDLTASIEDGGREFDPLSLPIPDLNAPLEARQVGGLGIHLMRSLMDRVEYSRAGGKNVLTMHKRVR